MANFLKARYETKRSVVVDTGASGQSLKGVAQKLVDVKLILGINST